MKILNIVGARPNFIKIAPIVKEMRRSNRIACTLLHTGQHYDSNMNHIFFEQLQIPKPDHNLGVGSGTIPEQISEIIKGFEPILDREKPDAILVVGDVSSTIACAMVAGYKKVPIIHVEAGLRSFDRNMPEEINRVLTDQISDLLFTTEVSAEENLKREGISSNKIHFVGNVMVDSLLHFLPVAEKNVDEIFNRLKLEHKKYALLTLHRPSNVDEFATLKSILEAIAELSKDIQVVFPMHPRTEEKIQHFELSHLLESIVKAPPIPYLDTICLMNHSRMVLTDSGGMQEETTVLGVPCLTLRENTERPITVDQGTNKLVGNDKQNILQQAREVLHAGLDIETTRPELWDGCAAQRIIDVLLSDSEND
jgi:UDP-N-acetylglucosamine 2-epimerase (non-hydrolysing)